MQYIYRIVVLLIRASKLKSMKYCENFFEEIFQESRMCIFSFIYLINVL